MKTVKSSVAQILLLLLLVLFDQRSVSGQENKYRTQYRSPNKFLTIQSDHHIRRDRCLWITERILKAYRFDNEQEEWQNQDLLWNFPLEIRILNIMKGNDYAVSVGQSLLIIADDYLDNELSQGTFAHELTHIQDARQLKGGKIPNFLLEGRALTNGHNYRMHLKQALNDYDYKMAYTIAHFTPNDAKEVLSHHERSSWQMETMGTFLVEYMRTKWHGMGIPNIHPKLSRMIERIGNGIFFKEAFEQEFGEPFSAFAQDFKDYLEQTQTNPKTRLEKTIWQNIDISQ